MSARSQKLHAHRWSPTFSTASVMSGNALIEQKISALPESRHAWWPQSRAEVPAELWFKPPIGVDAGERTVSRRQSQLKQHSIVHFARGRCNRAAN
jgi:hypothetical protein